MKNSSTKSNARPVRFRLVGTSRDYPDQVAELMRSGELEVLARSFEKQGAGLADRFEEFTLEDDSVGAGVWTEVLLEDLRGRKLRGEIDHATFRALEWTTSR